MHTETSLGTRPQSSNQPLLIELWHDWNGHFGRYHPGRVIYVIGILITEFLITQKTSLPYEPLFGLAHPLTCSLRHILFSNFLFVALRLTTILSDDEVIKPLIVLP